MNRACVSGWASLAAPSRPRLSAAPPPSIASCAPRLRVGPRCWPPRPASLEVVAARDRRLHLQSPRRQPGAKPSRCACGGMRLSLPARPAAIRASPPSKLSQQSSQRRSHSPPQKACLAPAPPRLRTIAKQRVSTDRQPTSAGAALPRSGVPLPAEPRGRPPGPRTPASVQGAAPTFLMEDAMAKRAGAMVVAGLTASALCLWSDAAAARGGHFGGFGGGGMRFGGGHFGGGGTPFGGMRFGGGGMRFGGSPFMGGPRFGGAPFGGMRFGRGPFVGGPRFGGAPFGAMRFGRGPFVGGPRFGGAPSQGMRFGAMPRRGPAGFANHPVNRPLARATPGSAQPHAFARGNLGGVNRFAGMGGVGAAGAAAGRALHGQAAGGRPLHAFNGRGLGHVQHAAFRHNAFANKVVFHNRAFKHFGCCSWFGTVFWPFVVGDVFTDVFWPSFWYEPFWGYDGDFALSNVLWVGPGSLSAPYGNIYDIYGGGSDRISNAPRSDEKVATPPSSAPRSDEKVDTPPSSDTNTDHDLNQACTTT